MSIRLIRTCCLVILSILIGRAALASSVGDLIERAEDQLNSGDSGYIEALNYVESAIIQGANGKELFTALVIKGRCLARSSMSGESASKMAIEAFEYALRIDPAWTPTESFSEPELRFYNLARDRLAQPKLGAELVPMTNNRQGVVLSPPSAATSLLVSAGAVISSLLYLQYRSDANNDWEAYESSTARSQEMYDAYDSSAHKRNFAGGVTLVGLAAAAYLWLDFADDNRRFESQMDYIFSLRLDADEAGARVTFWF